MNFNVGSINLHDPEFLGGSNPGIAEERLAVTPVGSFPAMGSRPVVAPSAPVQDAVRTPRYVPGVDAPDPDVEEQVLSATGSSVREDSRRFTQHAERQHMADAGKYTDAGTGQPWNQGFATRIDQNAGAFIPRPKTSGASDYAYEAGIAAKNARKPK